MNDLFGKMQKPVSDFALDDEYITKIARSAASRLCGLAKHAGQTERLATSSLIDLYYQMNGRCAQCGCVLTKDTIQLDHINECNYRRAISRFTDLQMPVGGKIACIENVQWMCKFCNAFKERCRAAGIDLLSYVSSVQHQASQNYPIRSSCKHLGRSGARQAREDAIKKALESGAHVTVSEMQRRLQGTVAETSYACLLQHMKECGWQKNSDFHAERKIAVIRELFEKSPNWETLAALHHALNLQLGSELSGVTWNSWIRRSGIRFTIKRSRWTRTRVSAGDRQTVLAVLKPCGAIGMAAEEIVQACKLRGVDEYLARQSIDALASVFAIYSRDNGASYVASLDRKEAAKVVGVSWLRLKKWATVEFQNKNPGPPYMKASEKGFAYYRHEDLEEFLKTREPHFLDLSKCGQRSGCVDGGRLGGRPATEGMTDRQHEVWILHSKGMTYREIGEQLGISRYTVVEHAENARRKLNGEPLQQC